jgi:hypothetical protein
MMRLLLLAVATLLGCSGSMDCSVLAARYAAAFAAAQRCVPGQDTCTYAARET